MSLKQIIKEQTIMKEQGLIKAGVMDNELTLPEEPLIFSIKIPIGARTHPLQHFRNQKFKGILRCFFREYLNTNIPVVIIVKFYVSPPSSVIIKPADLRKETIPAVRSYELADYVLSFTEMLHRNLIKTYTQIVKIDAEKYYSSNPRTVFKFMKWDHYVQIRNTNNTKSKTIVAPLEQEQVQS